MRGLLGHDQLGYLTANTGGALKGVVSGPERLTANTGGALTANTGGALTANTGGALTANTGGALTANTGGAYRVSGATVRVANGFVYLTAPDERFYVTADRRLYGTITDAEGRFDLAGPASDSVVVNVLLTGNRRLTAVALPGEPELRVNLASTLVTEFLRAKSGEYRFTFGQALGNAEARASLERIRELTEKLFESDAVLAGIKADDLTLNNLPLLRQRYAVAFGTSADRSLSDEWVTFLRTVKGDLAGPDARYRVLAVTDLHADVPPGHGVLSAAAGAGGAIYLFSYSRSSAELRELTAAGTRRVLLSRARSSASAPDALSYARGLAIAKDGRLVLADAKRQFIALFDPSAPESGAAFDRDDPDGWTNPRLLIDTVSFADEAAPEDVTLDDAADPGLYFVDLGASTVWYVPKALSSTIADSLGGPFAGVEFESPGAGDPVPASGLADLKLNGPSAITFHRRASDGVPFLYVADSGNHTLLEIDLATKTVRRVAGAVPPYREGAREAGCYTPAEEGGDPLAAHLRYPGKLVFDAKERLVVADADNNRIRLIDVYAPAPRIWTIAGTAQPDDDACGDSRRLPAYAFEDGEARNVAIGTPLGLALDSAGDLIVADDSSNRARKLWLSRLK